MIASRAFPSEFDARVVDRPVEVDFAFGEHAGSALGLTVLVEPWRGGGAWSATFFAPAPAGRSATGLSGTPSPSGLCVVAGGTPFVGDVHAPERFAPIPVRGPVLGIHPLADQGVLLLATRWDLTAVDVAGPAWTTGRIAIDGFRMDEAADGWLRGVADPDDDEPRDFAVELATGRLVGGAAVD